MKDGKCDKSEKMHWPPTMMGIHHLQIKQRYMGETRSSANISSTVHKECQTKYYVQCPEDKSMQNLTMYIY